MGLASLQDQSTDQGTWNSKTCSPFDLGEFEERELK
jgi:hypothetical protein